MARTDVNGDPALTGNGKAQNMTPGAGGTSAPTAGVDSTSLAALGLPGMGGVLGNTGTSIDPASINSLLQTTVMGNFGAEASRTFSSDPYNYNPNLVPDWVRESGHAKDLYRDIQAKAVDPFMPYLGGSDGFTPSWQVYMGKHKERDNLQGKRANGALPPGMSMDNAEHMGLVTDESGQNRFTKSGHRDDTMSAGAAANQPYLWDDQKIKDTMTRMAAAGFDLSPTAEHSSFDKMVAIWGGMVQTASMRYSLSHGKIKATPWDILDMYKTTSGADGSGGGASGAAAPFTGTKSMTSKSVTDITDGDAWASLQNTLSKMLGRDPTHDEVRQFAYRMNGLAASNPSITTQSADYKNGDVVSQSSHTRGGFNANDIQQHAYEQAQNNPDYAEYQSATTYFNAALSALGAIGNAGNNS